MTKTKILLGILIIGVLVASGAVLAAEGNQKIGQRVYVLTENPAVKIMLGVRHEFPNGFSTEISPQLKVLTSLGLIKTEPVQIYQITGKPDCGNGTIEGGEKCGEPNLPGCPEGQICKNCKCVKEIAEPKRACRPGKTPWGIAKVNGGSGGAGITVAVLDTGVYKDHLDLKANIVGCKDATDSGGGIIDGCADNNGHGTHVSGTILADGGADGLGIYGVAPKAQLMAIKVCGATGCWDDDIAAGIYYAADNGANIISMSLGGDTQSSIIKGAIDDAVSKGVLVIAAAGNDGPADGSIDYPAANAKVIAVGAIDSRENVPDWSSRGIIGDDDIIEEGEIEFAAPGVKVKSTWKNGCYNTISGTSMATPHIAGLAAKCWEGHKEHGDASTVRTICLKNIAKDIWTEGYDTATGFGLPIATPPVAPMAY